jgi:hypothetical protein
MHVVDRDSAGAPGRRLAYWAVLVMQAVRRLLTRLVLRSPRAAERGVTPDPARSDEWKPSFVAFRATADAADG